MRLRVMSPLSRRASGALALIALVCGATAAHALPVGGFAGYDHSRGPLERRTDAFLAGAGFGLAGAELVAAGLRYDDTVIGRGYGLVGIAGLPIAPFTQARFAVTRFVGDETYNAWRTRVGPRFAFPTGQTLWLAWVHDQDNAGTRSNGAIAEASTPLVPALTGRMNASWTTVEEGPAAMQAALGLGWRAVPQLELSGEVGLGRNGAGSGGFGPGHGLPGFPLLGSEEADQWGATALIGLRVLIP